MSISVDQIESKLGKKGFADFVVNNRSREKTKAEKDRGVRGRLKWRMCEHGVETVNNFKATGNHCDACHGMIQTKTKEFKPYFNIGLGVFVESRSDEKKSAKKLGLIEAA